VEILVPEIVPTENCRGCCRLSGGVFEKYCSLFNAWIVQHMPCEECKRLRDQAKAREAAML
jgi:hypothetical protein